MTNLKPTTRSARRRTIARRGFTMIELVLSMVLGAMVLTGCLGVFLALRNMESTFSARFDRGSELDITHTIITRSMLSLQMQEAAATTVTRTNSTTPALDDEPEARPRMILMIDPTVGPDSTGWIPQRFEVVNATPPVPSGLSTQAAGWYVAQDQSDTLNFSAMDGSQGIVRGVFELRPAGEREQLMINLGLINKGDLPFDEPKTNSTPGLNTSNNQQNLSAAIKPNWTLWWRPILTYEGEQLVAGYGPYPDAIGTPDEIRARLAGAVPLMRNIERCIWELYKGDEFLDTYAGLTMSDLPAYAQFELILTNSQYASWMFEIDWILGDDPSTDGSGSAGTLADDTGAGTNGQPGGPGNGTTDGQPTQPGSGRGNPRPTTTIDLGGS